MERMGLTVGSRRDNDEEVIALTRRADQLGYDTVWTGESWGRDVFTVLTMIACHTENIRVGTGITTVYSRTPGMIAQSIGSLDIISKGRATLGLGTSGKLVIEEWHGVKYEKPLQRTREYIDIIRLALAGQRVNYDGEFFKLGRFRLPFSPVQERIPIYVASLGPKNLDLTGELADGWLPIWTHVDHLPGLIEQIGEGAVKAGRSVKDVTVAPQTLCFVANSAEERALAQRLIRAHMAYYIAGMGTYYWDLFKRYGYEEECDRVRAAWARNERGEAASQISDDMLDKITVYGNAEECLEKLARFREKGVDMPVMAFPQGCPSDIAFRTLEALAPGG